MRCPTPVAAALVLLCLVPSVPLEGRTVGHVSLVRFWGYGRAPGGSDWRDLFPRDPVRFGETLRTPAEAALHIRFDDGATLRLGEASRLVIDAYVYDPASGAGEAAFRLAKGVFRFISGRMDDRRVRFETPVATVGILGTDVWIEVLEDGTTVVDVTEGRVGVVSRAGGAPVAIAPGENVLVDGVTGTMSVGPRTVTRDPGLTVDAGMAAGGPGAFR